MNRRDIQDILNLCLNEVHGTDSWLYHKVPNERIKEIYIKLIEEEHNRDIKVIEKFKTLPKGEKVDIFNIIRENMTYAKET